jgi:hypothetical protein
MIFKVQKKGCSTRVVQLEEKQAAQRAGARPAAAIYRPASLLCNPPERFGNFWPPAEKKRERTRAAGAPAENREKL